MDGIATKFLKKISFFLKNKRKFLWKAPEVIPAKIPERFSGTIPGGISEGLCGGGSDGIDGGIPEEILVGISCEILGWSHGNFSEAFYRYISGGIKEEISRGTPRRGLSRKTHKGALKK